MFEYKSMCILEVLNRKYFNFAHNIRQYIKSEFFMIKMQKIRGGGKKPMFNLFVKFKF